MMAGRFLHFGRAGLEERRRKRIEVAAALEAAQALEWRQLSLLTCPGPHTWARFREKRAGSPLCPKCGYTRRDLGLTKRGSR